MKVEYLLDLIERILDTLGLRKKLRIRAFKQDLRCLRVITVTLLNHEIGVHGIGKMHSIHKELLHCSFMFEFH